jgi:predicted nucleotidyltransferase
MIQEAETLLQRLYDEGVEFVIIGGICNVLHGVTLVTQDVDVCCRFTSANLHRLEEAVKDLHPVRRQTPQKLPFVLDDRLSRELKNIYLRTDMGVIDCLNEVAGIGDFDSVLQVSVPVDLGFGVCRMLGLEALIRSKETMGRDHDLAALRQLRAIQERTRNRSR